MRQFEWRQKDLKLGLISSSCIHELKMSSESAQSIGQLRQILALLCPKFCQLGVGAPGYPNDTNPDLCSSSASFGGSGLYVANNGRLVPPFSAHLRAVLRFRITERPTVPAC